MIYRILLHLYSSLPQASHALHTRTSVTQFTQEPLLHFTQEPLHHASHKNTTLHKNTRNTLYTRTLVTHFTQEPHLHTLGHLSNTPHTSRLSDLLWLMLNVWYALLTLLWLTLTVWYALLTQGGVYMFQLMEHYTTAVSVLVMAVLEIAAISWILGSTATCLR